MQIKKIFIFSDDPERQPLYPGVQIAALNREKTEMLNERKKSISNQQNKPIMLFRQKTRSKLVNFVQY